MQYEVQPVILYRTKCCFRTTSYYFYYYYLYLKVYHSVREYSSLDRHRLLDVHHVYGLRRHFSPCPPVAPPATPRSRACLPAAFFQILIIIFDVLHRRLVSSRLSPVLP